ncbi:MAG: hypothetical protein LLG14_17525 [Nocardiaceae bacterium]|nr:hypothetical protein [Nocardiaceae bacterium]
MNTIRAIQASISQLSLADAGVPLSERAALAVIDANTLAIVPFSDRYAQQIYNAITGLGIRLDGINVVRNAITVTI